MKRVDIISKVVGRSDTGKPVGGGISIPMGSYALKSDIESLKSMFNDFLEGDDTDSVINRWKDLEAFLNGISEDNTLDSILKAYVTLSGTQTIIGEKNFTGGLKVNGSPIYYDTEKKYWKLEGDLLVTGGVTMYGNDSDFVASTIMDAILYDDSTLGINSQGQLYVKGSVGGATTLGSLTNVGSWADSVASQDRIMYQAANSSQWVAKNLSDLAVGGVTGDYLPLTGGQLSGTLVVGREDSGNYTEIRHERDWTKTAITSLLGTSILVNDYNGSSTRLNINSDLGLFYTSSKDNHTTKYPLLHSGNYSSYALPLSGGTLSGDLLFDNNNHNRIIMSRGGNYAAIGNDYNKLLLEFKYATYSTYHGIMIDEYGLNYTLRTDNSTIEKYKVWNEYNDGSSSGLDADLLDGKHYSDIINGNVASATRLQAYQYNSGENILISGTRTDNTFPRYIYDNGWGLCLRWQDSNGAVHNGIIATLNDNVASATKLQTARTIWGQSFDGTGNVSGDFVAHYVKIYDDNVIEATSNKKLHLNYYATSDMSLCYGGGNVGIGTSSPSCKLHVAGDILATGGITMYSARKLKNIQDERGLSLKELSVIKPTRYTWKDGRDDKVHIGGIADDVMKVLPEVIYKAGEDDTLTMDYGNAAFAIAASLIKPVVNHEERIKLLEDENKRLKEEVEQLKWNIA